MALGHTKKGAFTALIPCLPMFFSTWETYHTHTLYLGYFNGPTGMHASFIRALRIADIILEGLILACTIMILSGIYGPYIWTQPISDLVGYPEVFNSHSIIDLWIPILLVSFFVAHLPACVTNVIKARRAQNLPVAPVFLEWTPILVYTGSCGAWLYSPYSTLLQEKRLVLFCLTMSFVFGRMTTKIILAHLTRQPFPYWTVMLVPLVGGAVLMNVPYLGFVRLSAVQELWYLRAYFVFAVVAYFRWALLVINSICSYLGINCLTITEKPAPGQSTNSKRVTMDGGMNGKKSQ
ncbi:hypothetical protein MMC27_005286 [Xylographa pallens]|nr:hypothetical protein [Xylographa pallens]